MLIISRRLNETFKIGTDITVMVTAFDAENRVVRLGIDAPRHIPIERDDAIKKRPSKPR